MRAGQVTGDAGEVLIVLAEQYLHDAAGGMGPTKRPWWSTTARALSPAHHLAWGDLLVDLMSDNRRVGGHDLAQRRRVVGREHILDTSQSHESPIAEDRDVCGRIETTTRQSQTHVPRPWSQDRPPDRAVRRGRVKPEVHPLPARRRRPGLRAHGTVRVTDHLQDGVWLHTCRRSLVVDALGLAS
jgi:hypothetical protein